jgi:hypothetical protein
MVDEFGVFVGELELELHTALVGGGLKGTLLLSPPYLKDTFLLDPPCLKVGLLAGLFCIKHQLMLSF